MSFLQRYSELNDAIDAHDKLFPTEPNAKGHFLKNIEKNSDQDQAELNMQALEAKDTELWNAGAWLRGRVANYWDFQILFDAQAAGDQAAVDAFVAHNNQVKLDWPKP